MRKLDDRVDLQVSMLLAVFVAVVALTCLGCPTALPTMI